MQLDTKLSHVNARKIGDTFKYLYKEFSTLLQKSLELYPNKSDKDRVI